MAMSGNFQTLPQTLRYVKGPPGSRRMGAVESGTAQVLVGSGKSRAPHSASTLAAALLRKKSRWLSKKFQTTVLLHFTLSLYENNGK